MTAAILLQPLCFREFDNNGNPLAFGTVTSYQAGTTTPTPTYTDSTAGTPNANPLTLNARGEAQIWCLPNVSYKFVVADSTGNTIRTVDNVQQSQLLSLYGGVDTGVANAYVITFTASFSAYADGIVLYWIPSNSNTGASTINVNGLGVINITNPDGTSVVQGQIVANQPASILYKGGAFILLTSSLTTAGQFTATATGFSGTVTTTIFWQKITNVVTAYILSFTGTSNAGTFTLTGLPAKLTPIITQAVSCAGLLLDNGSVLANGEVSISSASTLIFSKLGVTSGFTTSGSKGLNATLVLTWITS